MPWTVPLPQDTWGDRDTMSFLREVHTRIKAASFTWNPASVSAGATLDTTLTSASVPQLKGLRAGMAVQVTPPSSINSGLHVTGAWVPADNQLTVRLYNSTAGALDAGSAIWAFMGVLP
ncbi:MAG TPA: hypothetical protein VEA41_01820 [Salinarimonas sp.]|nr:hypothetical protein [Salinarimonas sp.]